MRKGFHLVALVFSGALCLGAAPLSPKNAPIFKLIIGPETTRVSGPMLPDGTIDYGAALWKIWSKGVTESNNANPLFEKMRDEWSGYPAADLSGDAEEAWDKHLDEATSHPWKPGELPDIAAWLKANEKGLALAMDASTRTHFCPAKPAVGALPFPVLSGVRGAVQALAARAMQRVASGDQDGARADVLAVHRLSLLFADDPNLIGYLFGAALDARAQKAQLGAVRASDRANAVKWLNQRLEMKPVEINQASIDAGQRYGDLNDVMLIIRGNAQGALEELTGLNLESMFTGKAANDAMLPGDLGQVDWNVVLKHINAVDDQMVTIFDEKDLPKRLADGEHFDKERETEKSPGDFFDDVMGPSLLGLLNSKKDDLDQQMDQRRQALIKQVDDFLRRGNTETVEAYSLRIAGMLTHREGILNTIKHAAIGDGENQIYTAAMALEVYKKKNGNYPDTLAALVPGVLKQAPVDPFTGHAPLYRREGAGYIVYSVGPNGVDDGGETGDGKDDLAVKSADQGSRSAAGTSRDSPAPR